MKIYLAQAMTGLTVAEVMKISQIARAYCRHYRFEWYSPIDDEGLDQLPPHTIVTKSSPETTMRWYVEKDEAAIGQCNALIYLTGDRLSDGANWEMAHAHYHQHIPVIVVSPLRAAGQLMGFTNIKADRVVATMGEAFEWLHRYRRSWNAIYATRETVKDHSLLHGKPRGQL